MSKLILASKSKARQDLLRSAGFEFEAKPSTIDERAIEKEMLEKGAKTEAIAQSLANHKALSISQKGNNDYVIGSDQILIFEDQIISKAEHKDEALQRLKLFRGKTHYLASAVCVAKDGDIQFEDYNVAALTMRSFSDTFLDQYVSRAGDALTSCVGCYALEDIGVQLFEKIEGDYFTILGMPMLGLVGFLQKEGFGL